jgi:hypothetical protein
MTFCGGLPRIPGDGRDAALFLLPFTACTTFAGMLSSCATVVWNKYSYSCSGILLL